MYRCIPALFFTLSLISCLPNKEKNDKPEKVALEAVTINDGQFTMEVPEFMSKASSLNDAASLQYQNIFKETYVIVIDESKDEYLNAYKDLDVYDTARSVIANYMDTQVQSTTSSLDVIEKSKIASFKTHGLKAKSIEIDANLEGVSSSITYFMTCIEGRDHLYMVLAWTLRDKKDKHRETFKRMVRTFREGK